MPLADDKTSQASGVPYPSQAAGAVTPWSLAAYEQLKDWAASRGGSWQRWDPEYLVLTIASAEGESVEKVVIDTADEELTVEFGYWESHSPEDDAALAAADVRRMAEEWLSGAWSTAIYFDANGKWCGSRCVEGPGLPAWLSDIEWIKYFAPTHVEIRRARRSEWRRFAIADDKLMEVSSAT